MSDAFVVVQLFQFPTYEELEACSPVSTSVTFPPPRTVQIFLAAEPLFFNNAAASQLHLEYSELMFFHINKLKIEKKLQQLQQLYVLLVPPLKLESL